MTRSEPVGSQVRARIPRDSRDAVFMY